MYLIGILVAAVVAFIFSRTIFRGPPQPFVLELPSWRWPQFAVVAERVREAAVSFLKNAGTLILAVSIIVWALEAFHGRYLRLVLTPNLPSNRVRLCDRVFLVRLVIS